MCRFLLCKSETALKPSELLRQFAAMAKECKAPDGDWQGDGWGIAWLNTANLWQRYVSLRPVWEDSERFPDFPETKVFAVHARSSSFPDQEGILEYNQPFVSENHAFVFNGFLKGVSLDLPGKIGAQKIWHLLQTLLRKNPAWMALEKTKQILLKNCTNIQALNIGLADAGNIDALCFYNAHPGYYQLHEVNLPGIRIIRSNLDVA